MQSRTSIRILAIDPGFDRVGIALIDLDKKTGKEIYVYSECFTTKKTDSFGVRLLAVGKKIDAIIDTYRPNILAIEELFMAANKKTGIAVAQARGVILFQGQKNNLLTYEYTPLQIKIAVCGYGRAEKKQVMEMVPRLLVLDTEKTSDDELDALAVGLTCIAHEKNTLLSTYS